MVFTYHCTPLLGYDSISVDYLGSPCHLESLDVLLRLTVASEGSVVDSYSLSCRDSEEVLLQQLDDILGMVSYLVMRRDSDEVGRTGTNLMVDCTMNLCPSLM